MTYARRTSERLIRTGALVTLVGAIAALVTAAPLLLGDDPFPTWVYLVAMLAPVGMALAIAGVVVQVRGRSRATHEARRRAAHR